MKEFDKYFEKEENLNTIFADYASIFDSLNEYRTQFLGNVITTEEDLKIALAFYTGALQTLQPLYQVAQSYKESMEDGEALRIRNEAAGKEGKGPTDSTVKTMAHYSVRNFIKVRNLLEAYTGSCERGINTCQTLLKYVRKEEMRTQS